MQKHASQACTHRLNSFLLQLTLTMSLLAYCKERQHHASRAPRTVLAVRRAELQIASSWFATSGFSSPASYAARNLAKSFAESKAARRTAHKSCAIAPARTCWNAS